MTTRPGLDDLPPPQYDTGVGSTVIRAVLLAIGFILLIPLLPFSIRIVKEYERGVIFRLGRLIGAKGPGLFVLIPIVDRMVKVDLRTVTLDVPAQEAITRDNVTLKVYAVLYFRVVEPTLAVVAIRDYTLATTQIAQTTLRSVLGQSDLDELLSSHKEINQRLQQIIDDHTEPWGIKVSTVEVKDVELPASMQRAMARQAEAERERRAKIIAADGEFQASERLSEAASVMARQPISVQLRFFQTLAEISIEKNSTIILPFPMEVLSALSGRGTPAAQVVVPPTPAAPQAPPEAASA